MNPGTILEMTSSVDSKPSNVTYLAYRRAVKDPLVYVIHKRREDVFVQMEGKEMR